MQQGKQRHADESQVHLGGATQEGGAEGGDKNLHGREGDWTQGYVTKQEKSHNTGLLAEVYTSELGALYMEDPSWFAWHSSTVPTKEREIDGIGSGNRHAAPESAAMQTRRQRNENAAPPVRDGTPAAGPALARGSRWGPPPSPPSL